jgi:Protein of unknown function (DUF642)
MKKFLSIGSIVVSSLALNLISVGQVQAVNLVTNGDFTTNNVTAASAYLGNTNPNKTTTTVDGWTFGATHGAGPSNGDNGYNFLVSDGTALFTDMAAQGNSPYGGLSLYGSPGQTFNSVNNTGWYIAADAWFDNASISQTLNGLTDGAQYTVSFSQASGQQSGFTGNEIEYWKVGFGGSTQNSAIMNITSAQPVSGWQSQSLTFTADGTSQVLSFLATGTQDVPPFALLSGISVEAVPANGTQVPEPENYVGTLIGIGFVGTLIKSRLAKKKLDEQD